MRTAMCCSAHARLHTHQQIQRILGGDVRALARAITLVENRDPAALPILRACFPYTGRAKTVGITGSPGVGKSTLAGRLATEYCGEGIRVAILAVDPSSPFSGGAMLGDRIRIQLDGRNSCAYIRSMATRGHLGGLTAAAAEVVDLLDAAGFNRILIESVGAGQDEVEITSVADVIVLVAAPGLGDSVQLMKSGLNEIADVFVINKGDDSGTEALEQDVRAALRLGIRKDHWRVPVALTNAREGSGGTSLLRFIEAYLGFLKQSGASYTKAVERWKSRILDAVREAIQRGLASDEQRNRIAEVARQVVEANANPYESLLSMMTEMSSPAERSSARSV